MSKKLSLSFCYLCGNSLESDLSNDHVPPKQFFPDSIRKADNSLKLLTLPTHKACNKAYQVDEDYFVTSIGPMAMASSVAGRELWKDITKRIRRPQNVALATMIGNEFSEKLGSLYLPHGKVVKGYDGDRVWRILWKITRGLFTYETKRFLPHNTPKLFKAQLDWGNGKPPEEFFRLVKTPIKGNHKGIFAYRYLVDDRLNGFNLWSMLLWDAWIVVIGFHDPDCSCDICSESKA